MKRDEFVKKVVENFSKEDDIIFQFPQKNNVDARSSSFDIIRTNDLSIDGKNKENNVKKVIFIY